MCDHTDKPYFASIVIPGNPRTFQTAKYCGECDGVIQLL